MKRGVVTCPSFKWHPHAIHLAITNNKIIDYSFHNIVTAKAYCPPIDGVCCPNPDGQAVQSIVKKKGES
ncbi:hypothetical protein QFZ77_006325 [Paenibacillus sp. V4I3]|nr:hypothetical protein [Paenibacillus sp. V4I3]MDQ0886458.1 hypothetical protein [Paenibacillus sp. V4I9]